MPHVVLEYSANVIEPDFFELFRECHQLLEKQLPAQIKSCKSRAVKCANYYVGEGMADNAFVHVTLKVMPGRPRAVLQAIGRELLVLLKKYFSESARQLNLGFSVEINELALPYTKG
ncbi:MAG: 5-carboxymethyl-2-hydroxymuconate Delta-isomerase [Proteobacteria bacterium]|nr:5-carboxymethyl-2-hydroxymuconate Delta-isomerase [Pseudomonadota bacterium]